MLMPSAASATSEVGALAEVLEVLLDRRDHVLDDFNIVLFQQVVHLVDLFDVVIQFLERVADFLGGQLALRLAALQKFLQNGFLFLYTHCCMSP